jgi:two-component sensor histidine kinase/CHASE1-domain containing sensor protein
MTQGGKGHDRAAWLVMAVAFALALVSWRVAMRQDQRQAVLQFETAVDHTTEAIAARMRGQELALRAVAALFDASAPVGPEAFARFVSRLRLHDGLSGIRQLGVARPSAAWTSAAGSPVVTADPPVRTPADGVAGARVTSAVIERIEPHSDRDRLPAGNDLAAHPARRAALDLARDSGEPVLSGPLRPESGIGSEGGAQLLMALALYRDGDQPGTVEARRERIDGFVYTPLNGDDLMRAVIPNQTQGLGVMVYDGADERLDALLHANRADGEVVHVGSRILELPGRRWLLRFEGTDVFDAGARSGQPLLVAAVGGLMILALFAYLTGESRLRRRIAGESQRLAAEVDGRREAERAIRNSERRFRKVVEASPTGLLVADTRGRIVLANPQAERLFGHEPGGLLGLHVNRLVPDGLPGWPPGSDPPAPADPGAASLPPAHDLEGRRLDGTPIPLEVSLNPIGHAGDAMVLAAVADLTARHAAQAQLETALREKTVLLDEVHHRVKNNLQVITSLLALQARGAPPAARSALADCRNRVHAMALTHQLLHEHNDAGRLHAGEYLSRLARLLAESHRAEAPAVALEVIGADTPVYLSLPRAIPCGLLVNELVTNAYKHAFPDGRTGRITVSLTCRDHVAVVGVADDGAGLPADFDPAAARSLGFQLIPLLVDQMGAALERAAGPGTRFEVRLPVSAEGVA